MGIQIDSPDICAPAVSAAAVTPSDTTVLFSGTFARGFYVGVTGDVAVTTFNDNDVTFVGVPAGQIIPLAVKKIKATGTTATSIVALK